MMTVGAVTAKSVAAGGLSVSVVIASYHRAAQLSMCLDALASQTRPPDEVIVVLQGLDLASADVAEKHAAGWPELRCVQLDVPGTVNAYNAGLAAATADIVAYVDDDAVADETWVEQIVETFAQDSRIAAVGGRDVIFDGGRILDEHRPDAESVPVGRLRWFGRVIGNHHAAAGPPRDVDVLKGVNMSFRRAAVAGLGFDERLRGRGAQIHSELSICLPLRRRGLRVVYDPGITVKHFPAPRQYGDERAYDDTDAVLAWAHNEALQILDHFGPLRGLVYALWVVVLGTTEAPGLAVLGRDVAARNPHAWRRFVASQRGRLTALSTRRRERTRVGSDLPVAPRLLHRPEIGWRGRHVVGALRLRLPVAQHTDAEAALLMRYGAGCRSVVELGVAEGGSAAELRTVMASDGRLLCVDPHDPGRLGFSLARLIARRAVGSVRRGSVSWTRVPSDEAVREWDAEIDFLFIDADHSYERAESDWRLWTPFVSAGGYVALHDSIVFADGWTDDDSGPVRLLAQIQATQPEWEVVAQADSLTILRRQPSAGDVSWRPSAASRGEATARAHTPPRRRVLRVADVPETATAGMSGYMLRSAAEMRRDGHAVTFWFRERLAPGIAHAGARRLLIPWVIVVKVLTAVARGQRFDVVEIHEPLAAAYALVARLLGERLPSCVVLSFGINERLWQAKREHLRTYGRRPPLRSRILVPLTLLSQARLGLRLADAVIVPSTADRDYVIESLSVPAERVACAFTGVSEELFDVAGSPHAHVRLLFLGSWIERKGTLELVSAWRRLAQERASIRLTVAGVGNAEPVRAALAGLPRVDVVPEVARAMLPQLLAAHDVFVLPSWFEGMSLAMLEAAAAGLACVVCALCGNLDVFRPDDPRRDGAILVAPNDPDGLYRALLALVDDGELREALATKARERARSFTWGHNAQQTLEAYAGAVRRHRDTRARCGKRSPDGHREPRRL